MNVKRHTDRQANCIVTPVPSIGGERRAYRGLAQSFAAHAHPHYIIGRVVEGERELELNGNRVSISPGDLIVFNPGDVHGCRHTSADLFAYDSVTVAADVLGGVHLRFPRERDCEASRLFDALLRAIEQGDGDEVRKQVLLLAECLASDEVPSAEPTVHADCALRAFSHLRGHVAEPHALTELAAMEGISEYALIRAYRKRFSITPLQHLMSLRVENACQLLSQGAAPADVAAETGFADQAHLTRVFKQRIGTTPAAYGRMAAQDGVRK